jgi:hypothetical protein
VVMAEGKRRPGRPAKDVLRDDNIRLVIRLTQEERRRLRMRVAAIDSDMGAYAREALLKRLEDDEARQ